MMFHVFFIKVRPSGHWFHGSSFVSVCKKSLKNSPKTIIEKIEEELQNKCPEDCSIIIGNIVNVESVFVRKRMFWDGFLFGIFWFFLIVVLVGRLSKL